MLGYVTKGVNGVGRLLEESGERLWDFTVAVTYFPLKVVYKSLIVAPYMALVGAAGMYLPTALQRGAAFAEPVAAKVAPYVPTVVANAFASVSSFFAAGLSKIASFIPASITARLATLNSRVAPYAPDAAVGLLAGKDQRNASRTERVTRATEDHPNPTLTVKHGVSKSDVVLETAGGIAAQTAVRTLLPAFAGVTGPAGFALSTLAFGAGAALVDTVKNDVPKVMSRFRVDSV